MADQPSIGALAQRQLDAYNAADLDAFCDCYSPDVVVLAPDGSVSLSGMETFRKRYATLFSDFVDVRASVLTRIALNGHAIDLEAWERKHGETGEVTGGTILVRYTLKDDRIGWVEFLR